MIVLRNKEYSSKALQVYTKLRTGFKKKPSIGELRTVVGEKNKAIYYANNPKAAAVDASVEGLKFANKVKDYAKISAMSPGFAAKELGHWSSGHPTVAASRLVPIPGSSFIAMGAEKKLGKLPAYKRTTQKLVKGYDKHMGDKVEGITNGIVNGLKIL